MHIGIGLSITYPAAPTGGGGGGDVTAPTLSSVATNVGGTTITLTYNEALDDTSEPATTAYTLAGTSSTVASLNVTGSTVVLTLNTACFVNQTITVSYTAPGAGNVQDSAGNDAGNLTNSAVTNNSTVFNPDESIAGLVAWIDMQDATSYTNTGGFVSAITNKASGVSWTEATNRPAVSATGLNSLPCMDFDGTNDRIISSEAAVCTALANQNDYTIFIVTQIDDLAAVEVIFSAADVDAAGPGSKRWGTNTGGAGRWTVIGTNDASAGIVANAAQDTVNTPVVYEAYSATQVTSLQINGAAVNMSTGGASGTPTAYGTLSPDRVAMGCRPSSTPASFFDGRIAELLIYDTALSTPSRALVRAYLGTKWSITVA